MGGQEVGILDIEPDLGAMPVIVGKVETNTPAEEAGLQPGDRIAAINGTTLRNMQQVSSLVQQYKAEPIHLTVERQGKMLDLTAQVRKLPDGTERLGFGYSRPNSANRRDLDGGEFAVNSHLKFTNDRNGGTCFFRQAPARDAG